MAVCTLVAAVKLGNDLGEGVQWRAKDQCVWWTDITRSTLYRMTWPEQAISRIDLPEPLGSFAFTPKEGVIIGAFATGFATFDVRSGDRRWLHRPDLLPGEMRFNDGRVDRAGRFWAGTLCDYPAVESCGRLFCLDLDGSLRVARAGISITNGLCWSPSGRTQYFADTPTRLITAQGYDPATGAVLQAPEPLVRMPEGCMPDGATVDAEGGLWSAQWGGGVVSRISAAGERLSDLAVPASQPTCAGFGGADLTTLFVTSARAGLSAAALEGDPQAGDLFVFKTPHKGLPENEYLGPC